MEKLNSNLHVNISIFDPTVALATSSNPFKKKKKLWQNLQSFDHFWPNSMNILINKVTLSLPKKLAVLRLSSKPSEKQKYIL